MQKPVALVTNDDGIDCGYLHCLVDALIEHFSVRVVAPADEQSWAGRSFTRHGELAVTERRDMRWPAWAVHGSPSDCVNLALGHLLSDRPDIVVSGINVGFNVSLPLVLTSGTVSAALEGALWGIPAVAVSQAVPHADFEAVKESRGHVSGERARYLGQAAERAASFAADLVESSASVRVHNLNFPAVFEEGAALERTQLANLRLGSLFQREDVHSYRFGFPRNRETIFEPTDSDTACLKRGSISHTILDYSTLGRT